MKTALLCREDLSKIISLISHLTEGQYRHQSAYLSQSTIGQHVRHIIEFYFCLLQQPNTEIVNYDDRKRDLEIETNLAYAIMKTNEIIMRLTKIRTNKPLILKGNFTLTSTLTTFCETNLERELLYCLEHSIHHQALIKVGLLEQHIAVSENFGNAPSTIRFRSTLPSN
jgi:hypothetical protein